jgi:hypothetical protein
MQEYFNGTRIGDDVLIYLISYNQSFENQLLMEVMKFFIILLL